MTLSFSLSLPSFFQSFQIRLGVYRPSIKYKSEQIRNYSLTVPYPEFDAYNLKNDLMMIKLSKAAALNSHVGTVAIALEDVALNESCFIPTWRWNEYKNRKCLTLFFVLRFWSWGRRAGVQPEGHSYSEVLFLTPER